MNILFVNRHATSVGGAEVHIRYLDQGMRDRGNETYLYAIKKDPIGEPILPERRTFVSNIKRDPIKQLRNPRAAREILRIVRENDIEVVHAHNIFPAISPLFFRECLKEGVRAIMTLHDYQIICPKSILFKRNTEDPCTDGNGNIHCDLRNCQGTLRYFYHRIKKKLRKRYLRGVRFIAPSHFMERTMRARGIGPVTTVHNGVPTGNGGRNGERTEERFHLLFMGRLYPEKGLLPLLEGYVSFLGRRKDADTKLYITGSGPLREEVGGYAAKYPEIEYLGFVPRKELTKLVRAVDLSVVPSLWPENCSISVLESLSAGTPVIASNTGGNPELVEDGKEGYLFSPGFHDDANEARDKIVTVLDRAYKRMEDWDTLSRKAFEKAGNRFSLDGMCEKIAELYERTI